MVKLREFVVGVSEIEVEEFCVEFDVVCVEIE